MQALNDISQLPVSEFNKNAGVPSFDSLRWCEEETLKKGKCNDFFLSVPLSYQHVLTCKRFQYSCHILIIKGTLYTINDFLLRCKSKIISDLLAEPESTFLISQAPSNI